MTGSHPEKIDKYEITDLLGEGAMGVVYRAMDSVLQRFVAVKLMTTGIARDPDLRERFLREARAAGSLQHPNIVTIYDFGEVGDQLFIAMQYIEGADLTEIIQRQDPLPLHAKIDIILDVLNGLAYAHRRGVIHRDIKPANIRISSDGRAHIMDFGIARLSESSMTRSGVLIGTPDYMSPEQVTGDELMPASDIFAVGTVMYELLTNTKPFKAETLHSVLYKIVSENPRELNEVIPGLPQTLQNIVSKALAKNPARRYPGAEPMIEDLTTFRLALSGGGEATIAVRRTPLRTPTFRKAERSLVRQRMSARFLAAAGVGVAVLIGALVWGATRDRDPRVSGIPPSTLATDVSRPPDSAAATPPAPPPTAAPGATPTAPLAGTDGRRADRARLDSTVATMRAGAVEARAGAQLAGATTVDLAAGEKLFRGGDVSARGGRAPEAMTRYAGASAAWSEAARLASARIAAARPPAVATQPPPATTAAPAPPVVVTTPAGKPPTPPQPTDHRPELEALIAAFAKALETMNIAELRRAYPGMTASQQSGWEQFFGSVTGLQADLGITRLDVNAATAEMAVTGTYTYAGRNGRQDRQPVSFVASARREGSGWRLTEMR